MKNQHITTLKKPIPIDIRIEVYKDAIDIIKNNIKHDTLTTNSISALCLLLPCILWDLDHWLQDTPAGIDWNHNDVPKAFPEIKQWTEEAYKFGGNSNNKNLKRIEVLQNAINKLTLDKHE